MQSDAIKAIAAAKSATLPLRIGLMGGTFDPIHTEHIRLAREAARQFSLSAVIFLVSGNPPHKKAYATAEQRYEMAKLAVADEPCMFVSDIELKREGTVYTVDTLKELKALLPDSEFFYIIGADTLKDLNRGWRSIGEVCKLTRFIVFARPNSALDAGELRDVIRLNTAETDARSVSSTAVRHALTQNLPTDDVMQKDVLSFIEENALYKNACMTYEEAQESIRSALTPKRFTHTAFVVQTAEMLALKYGENVQRARWAALLHDCAKCLAHEESIALLSNFDVELSEAEILEPALLHAVLGEVLAKEIYGVMDAAVLSAIRYHTTGRRGMTLLEKIVFLADAIEPTREYDSVEALRKLAFVNLDAAIRDYMDLSIEFVVKKGGVIDPNTVDGRNYLVIQLNKQRQTNKEEYE